MDGSPWGYPGVVLEEIAAQLHQDLEARNAAREETLQRSRLLIRHAAQTIQALHRGDFSRAQALLQEARTLARELTQNLARRFPDLYYAGYTQDALKEYVEANVVYRLFTEGTYPTPAELDVPSTTYVRGLAEAVGELRRRCLDLLRHNNASQAEQLLEHMDAIYSLLVTMDYPDALTGGLRRLTDLARSLIERTRGELTLSRRLYALQKVLEQMPPSSTAASQET